MGNVINIKSAAIKRDRLESYNLCESVLPVFEEYFGMNLALRSAMVGAKDYATGLIDDKMLGEYQSLALQVITEASKALLAAPKGLAEAANGGIMAAYAVYFSLDKNLDLAEVQRKVDKAFTFSPARSVK